MGEPVLVPKRSTHHTGQYEDTNLHHPCPSAPRCWCCSRQEYQEMANEKCQSLPLGPNCALAREGSGIRWHWRVSCATPQAVQGQPVPCSPSWELCLQPPRPIAAAVCAQKKWYQHLIRNPCPRELIVFSRQIKAELRRYCRGISKGVSSQFGTK